VLAPWACDARRSRGRRHPEPTAWDRDEHQRDRDRIVHSTAFRRLVYKTQVFLNHEGDLFRTRLTHSLEVAQLARTMARSLGLNEDLTEAIALGHDLGHTPFGHAGQDALHACMAEHGGFEHNLQSLRVVDRLEQRYASFDGLNLSFEAREGLLKHCSRRDAEWLEAEEPGGVGRRFLDGTRPALEAQLCDLADTIAYNAHDIDDGVRSGLLTLDDLQALAPIARLQAEVLARHPQLGGRRLLSELLRRLLSDQVHDLVAATAARLAEHRPDSPDAVRALPRLVGFSAPMAEETATIKRWLFARLYRHPQVTRTTDIARRVLRELFEAYQAAPQEMPAEHARREDRARAVADYIAGMTDRYAGREHARLTGRDLFAELAASQPAPGQTRLDL
jgi:dGTPase